MGFSTVVFIFGFFPVCIGGYYLCRVVQGKIPTLSKLRVADWFLLLACIGFFSWAGIQNAVGLCLYAVLVFLFGRWLQNSLDLGRRAGSRLFLSIGIIVLLLVLFYFKYFNYFADLINNAGGNIQYRTQWTLLGISFISFSAISYLVDIYRGDARAGGFLDTALYMTFFPKIVSGPIVLWKDFSSFLSMRVFSEDRFIYGINRFIIGLGKKVLIADTLGAVVSDIQSQMYVGIDLPTAWGCTLLYFLQIYYDFSGYSDTAIGLSAMFGFDLKENFSFPYISTSITEFWRRWHISLGTWFREYVYIPLGGNREGFYRTLVNLFIVFLVTGVWHGTGAGYLCWGIAHGICIVIERCIRDKKLYKRIPAVVKWAVTMFIVMLGWQVFHVSSLSENFYFYKILFGLETFDSINFTYQYYFTAKTVFFMVTGILGAVVLAAPGLKRIWQKWQKNTAVFIVQELALFVLFALTILFVVNSTYSPFIYFQY